MTATYDCIATTTLGSSTSTVTFSSISGTYTDLLLICNSAVNPQSVATLRVNSDSGSNYSRSYMQGGYGTPSAGRGINETSAYISLYSAIPAISTTHFLNYSNTTTFKTIIQNDQSYGSGMVLTSYLWRSTAAINSITIVGGGSDLLANSTFYLYGIKAE